MKRVTSILITMLLLCFPAYSQDESLTDSQTEQKSKQIEIYFDLNSYVDSKYSNNRETLDHLTELLDRSQQDTLVSISSIEINSFASPDGDRHYNEQIAKNRTNSTYDYLTKPIVEQKVKFETELVVPPIEIAPFTEPEPLVSEAVEDDKKPIKFALKTNLLYDLLLTPSFEVEVPIGDRWSVAGEWICPWWVTKDNGYALQVLSGQLEGRYWFGDRTKKPQLTGWFVGFYAGGGLYDLQWKNNGYQGEFYIAAGLAGGYAHTINKSGSLRMEYSLGVGYLNTEYRYYEGMDDNEFLVWQHDGRYTWIGPTKAKVSLVWFINWQRGGKR